MDRLIGMSRVARPLTAPADGAKPTRNRIVRRPQGIGEPSLIHPGFFRADCLVKMWRPNYRLEINVSFTPDAGWTVFRSHRFAPACAYAVEAAIEK